MDLKEKIIDNISKLTNRKITQFRFIIILNKETKNEMDEEYDEIYERFDNIKYDTNYEKRKYIQKII